MIFSRSIAFIDAAVEDHSLLLAGLASGIEVHTIRADVDGVAEISQVLRSRFHLGAAEATFDALDRVDVADTVGVADAADAVHSLDRLDRLDRLDTIYLVAHGAPGSLRLGCTTLSLETLAHYSESLNTWSARSIQLYSCQVAAGDAGAEFVATLQELTGAAIAASTQLVGAAQLGGSWGLDVQTSRERPLTPIFSESCQNAYAHTLNAAPLAPDDPSAATFDVVDLTFGDPIVTNPSGSVGRKGTIALYQNAGTYKGQDLDVTVTIVETEDPGVAKFKTGAEDSNKGNDVLFNFSRKATSGKEATLRFEFWKAGSDRTEPANSIYVPTSFTIKDLDKGKGASGAVIVKRDQVMTYGANDPTQLIYGVRGTEVVFESTANNPPPDNDEFALQLNFYQKSLDIKLRSEFGGSGFFFDGNREFKFSNLVTIGGDRGEINEDQILQVDPPAGAPSNVVPADNIVGNDFDPDGDPLTVSAVNGDPSSVGQTIELKKISGTGQEIYQGRLTVNSDGSYTYDPDGAFDSLNEGESTTVSFVYTVADGRGGEDDATVTITVDGLANPAGTLTPDSASVAEGQPTTINVQANDSLKGNVTLAPGQTFEGGTAVVESDNESITFTPKPFFSGEETVVYEVNGEATTLTLAFDPVAEVPTATAEDIVDGIKNQPIPLQLSGAALQDQDGSETLRYEMAGAPAGSQFVNAAGDSVGTAPTTAGAPWTFELEDLNGLQLLLPEDQVYENTPLALTLTGTSTDTATIGGELKQDTQSTARTFNLTVRNEPPNLDLNGLAGPGSDGIDFETSFAAQGEATPLTDIDATAIDSSGDDIEMLTLTVTGLRDGDAETLFVGETAIALSGNETSTVSLPGIDTPLQVIRSSSAGSDGSSTSTVEIVKTTGDKLTQAEMESLLRSLKYENAAEKPNLGDRTFSFVANDGSADSLPATSRVRLTGDLRNDNPPPTNENVSQLFRSLPHRLTLG